MLSSDFLFPRFFVVPLANPSNFSHCKCFSSRIWIYKSEHGYINLHENGFVIIITLLILHLRHH